MLTVCAACAVLLCCAVLQDEEECEMIVEDVEEECAKHGAVIQYM